MKNLLTFIACLLVLSTFSTRAQENFEDAAYAEIVKALNYETTNVYDDYISLFEEADTLDNETFLIEFSQKLSVWKSILNEKYEVYKKYEISLYPQISEVSRTASVANRETLKGIEYYITGFSVSDEAQLTEMWSTGDKYYSNGYEQHSNAVNLYNEYSGYNEQLSERKILIFFSIISSLFSLVLFIKSRNRSSLNAEIVRAAVYKELFFSSLWMTGGLVITTVGYFYALKTGGTYTIFYGAILVGGWQLLKGITKYLTNGRKTLNKLALEEKNIAIKSSYDSSLDKIYNEKEKKCRNCNSMQPSNSIVCSKCGSNLL